MKIVFGNNIYLHNFIYFILLLLHSLSPSSSSSSLSSSSSPSRPRPPRTSHHNRSSTSVYFYPTTFLRFYNSPRPHKEHPLRYTLWWFCFAQNPCDGFKFLKTPVIIFFCFAFSPTKTPWSQANKKAILTLEPDLAKSGVH